MTTQDKIITIRFILDHDKLIQENGVKTCIKIVPGTAYHLTHNKHYGKENR